MARAIIRYSFDGDHAKNIRAEIRKRLTADGRFRRLGTASWESTPGTSIYDTVSAIRWALEVVEASPSGNLDHVWIYIDDPSLIHYRKTRPDGYSEGASWTPFASSTTTSPASAGASSRPTFPA